MPSKIRDYKHMFEFKSRGNNLFSERGQEVLETTRCFLDDSVLTKPLEDMRDFPRALPRKMASQIAVAETEAEFVGLRNGKKHGFIFSVKEIKATIASPLVADGPADFIHLANTIGGIIHGGEELQVATVTSIHDFRKIGQTVDALSHGGRLVFPCSVAMFHPSVVSEGRYVIAVCLDAENATELVVQLDAVLAHVVAKAVPFNSCRKLAAQFPFEAGIQTPAEEHGQIGRFYGVSEGADQFLVNRGEGLAILEDDIRSVFDLHEAPMNAGWKVLDGGKVLPHHAIQGLMQQPGVEVVCQFLGLFKVVDVYEGVFDLLKFDVFLRKLNGQEIMCVAIELQSKGRPGGHAQIAESEIFVDEIKVVVETAAGIIFKEGLVGCLIMPGLEGCTCFHGRKDVDQTRMRPPLFENLFDTIFFAKGVDLFDELDGKIMFVGQRLCVLTYLVPVRGGPFLEIEDANAVLIKEACHCLRMADVRQRALYDNPVITGQNAGNDLCMTFREGGIHRYLLGQVHFPFEDDTKRSREWSIAA
jgi:hypothetical protein